MTAVPTSDHDLLIEIKTKLDLLIKGDTDKETRLRALERKVYLATGAAGVLGAAVGWALQLVGR